MTKLKKKKLKKSVILFLFILFMLLTLFSFGKIFLWKRDNIKTANLYNEIQEIVVIDEVDNEKESVEVVEQIEEIKEDDPYWDYIKMNLIHVDFASLKEKNNRTIGWIQVNGTNINYPFVQTEDNLFYLNHSFDNSYNEAGWVFLDYRNKVDMMDQNTIIYAHGRYDKAMFGSLRNILKDGWLGDTNNHVIKVSTEYENTLWQVFSVYKIETVNDYIRVNFKSNENYLDFLKMLQDRSVFDFKTKVTSEDKILTLSTCYDEENKVVLHAKLIKKEKRMLID